MRMQKWNEWIDGNIGSSINMKYPACILKGFGAVGVCNSIAIVTKKNQIQVVGAKIHIQQFYQNQSLIMPVYKIIEALLYREKKQLIHQVM